MTDGLPGFGKEVIGKLIRDLNRRDQSSVCPYSDFIMPPNHNVRTLPGLGGDGEIIDNVLGRLNAHLDPI
jgi:hypothetical protein